VQDGQGIGFVVVGNGVTQGLHGSNDLGLACVAFAGSVLLDRPHWHALVRDAVVLAPSGERGHQAAINVGGIHANVAAYLLEVDGVDLASHRFDFSQPVLEAQEAHATAFETLGLEADKAVGNLAVLGAQSPASGCPEVKGKDCVVHNLCHFWGGLTQSPQLVVTFHKVRVTSRVRTNGGLRRLCQTEGFPWGQLSA